MRAAVIDETGLVVNVIEVDDLSFDPGDGLALVELAVDSLVAIGWVLAGAEPEPPVEPEPEPVQPTELEQLRVLVEQLQRSVADQQAQLDEVADLMVGVL